MSPLIKKEPREIGNLLVMVMFSSLAIVQLVARDYVGASLWLSLAAAIASFGPEGRRWEDIPLGRRAAGLLMLGASAALFGYQVGTDFLS
jgi:hypothetical protein